MASVDLEIGRVIADLKKKKQRGWWGEGIEHILTGVLDFNKLW